ncbi:uncharacterized protein PV06_04034 [Exophiala oligosperma]|uniref:SnoaL-like domain-containing protein n=2 Tax=Chaetothyriales TaxID=34395 RepID=A0A0D2C791_9EURO|nr:uncharacterized protein PV06_04034 [Exophiala oligosperma]KAJ9637490.1 hypothetical protein H2204_004914 [Knufia peltigerae]KIW45662.1 hypothetical protein PV06_04034 [Exophiala oligosperma]
MVSEAYGDLSETARTILTTLSNPGDFTSLDRFISANVMSQHEDEPPVFSRDAFMQDWADILRRMPGFQLNIKEACVDEQQHKVWVRSEITGLPGGMRKESIDMMTFDDDGLLVKSVDCQRVLRTEGIE